MEGFAKVRPACASIKDLYRTLTRVFLSPAPTRYVRGSGPAVSIPLRMSRLVILTVFEVCVTVFYRIRVLHLSIPRNGDHQVCFPSLRLVQIAQNLVVASLVVKSSCSDQFQGHAIVLNIDFCGG